ncbi:hypothetical protein ABBQ38_004874 [Trebouxia sp. C0009 RCD-2024]
MLAERCRATCNTRVELALCLHSILNLDLYSQGWYAIRLRVQPCAANNDLRITTNAQQAGRAGQNKPEVSYPSQTDELHSEIFLVRFIQQEISLDHTVTLSVEQVADQVVNGFNQRGVLARVGASIPTTCTSTVFAAR